MVYSPSILSLFVVALMPAPPLFTLLLPFCGMALANGAIYPILVASALAPFPQVTGKAAGLQNLLAAWLVLPRQPDRPSGLQHALYHTTLVMVVTVVLAWAGYGWQRTK